MKENDCVQVKLDAWKTRIEVMEVEITGISDKTYCEVLTRLFNNQREHKQSILELINYYGNNRITLMINLSNYREHSYNSKEEDIEHIIDWVKSMCFYEDGIKVEWDCTDKETQPLPFFSITRYRYEARARGRLKRIESELLRDLFAFLASPELFFH